MNLKFNPCDDIVVGDGDDVTSSGDCNNDGRRQQQSGWKRDKEIRLIRSQWRIILTKDKARHYEGYWYKTYGP